MNATIAYVSGRGLLVTLGILAVLIAVFWGAWKLLQLITNPIVKQIAFVVWLVVLVIFAVDFLFGTFGLVSGPVIRL